MNIRNWVTLILICVFIGKIDAQEMEWGAIGGMNFNVVTLKSDYQFNEQASPNLSYNIGTTIKVNKDRKFGLLSLDYYRLSNNYEQQLIFYNEVGEYDGAGDVSVVLHNLRLSAVFNIKIIKGLFCGGGVAGNLNLNSKLNLNSDAENYVGSDFFGDKYEASFIRDLTISIPITIGYEFDKFDILFVFDKGVMNRLEGEDGFIKEINNVFSFNFNYRFLSLGN